MTDVVLLTDDRYENPKIVDDYIGNILLEAKLVQKALENRGLTVERKSWSNQKFDWSSSRSIVFRTTWDYFDRFHQFKKWLDQVKTKTLLINSLDIIEWNMDKHYLNYLKSQEVNIPLTIFAEKGSNEPLKDLFYELEVEQVILKPAVSGAARHTYKLNAQNVNDHQEIFNRLVKNESMMLQPFIKNIETFGEISLMIFDGKYSHAIIKNAKPGDFRVQDDFGGTVHTYKATKKEISFAEKTISACKYRPVYGRVDITYDNNDKLCVMELELVEPELWFRFHSPAAALMADAIIKQLS